MNNNNICIELSRHFDKIGVTQTQIANILGVTKAYVNSLFTGRRPFGKKQAEIWENHFGISKTWLLTGEGEMLKADDNRSSARLIGAVYPAVQGDDEVSMVTLVPVSAYASFIEVYGSGNETFDKMGAILTADERRSLAKLRIFEVDGESMYPTIKNGSYILTEEVPPQRWHNVSGVAVVIYGETVTLKRIKRNRLESENFLLLSADNEEYGEKTVRLPEIRAIFKARRIISAPID